MKPKGEEFMKISNRGELVELINSQGVETYPVKSKTGTRMVNTVIYNKYKDKFYRLEWGEVADSDQVYHLWFNEEAEEVYLNKSRWKDGWFTSDEISKIDSEECQKRGVLDMSEYLLHNVENNLVDVSEDLDFDNLKIVGGRAGKGKTHYAIIKTIEAIANGESVLFFSTENNADEINRRIVKVLSETRALSHITDKEFANDEDKMAMIDSFINEAKLTIDNNDLMDNNYVVNKMKSHAKTKVGLDFAVVDSLKVVTYNNELNNCDAFAEINNRLEDVSNELGCRVLITTQLNRSFC